VYLEGGSLPSSSNEGNQLTRTLTLTVTEAATVVGVSRAKGYELVRVGELPSIRFGGRLVVPLVPLLDRLGMTIGDWEALNSQPIDSAA
jgi:excisionase family DNA binding protein